MATDRARIFRFASLFWLLIATVLLFVSSLSTPIIKTLAYVSATDTTLGVKSDLYVGLWGVCFQTNRSSMRCSATGLGFSSVSLDGFPLTSDIAEAITGSLGFLLILHPIAAGLALPAFGFTIVPAPSSAQARIAYLFATLAAILSTVALAADLVLFNAARVALNAATPFKATFGAEIALVAVAALLLVFSSMALGARRRMLTAEGAEKA